MNTATPSVGPYYDDLVVGDTYRNPLGRTITDADNVWFTLLTVNTHPIHFDYRYGEESEFGRPLVNSALTLAVIVGQSVLGTSQNAVANLGWDEVRLPHPVFAGDTLYSESLILEKRPSQSRPDTGIVSVLSRGLNQDGVEVIRFKRTFLVHLRDASKVISPFPEPATPLLPD